jgi:hypothetical protein
MQAEPGHLVKTSQTKTIANVFSKVKGAFASAFAAPAMALA